MKATYLLLIGILVLMAACWWALRGSSESKETAFARIVKDAPASLVLKDYWAAQGMGGDGLNVFTFSIAQNDIAHWLKPQGYRELPLIENGEELLLKLEIEKVEQRTGLKFPLHSPYKLWCVQYESGIRKHLLFDTNVPANGAFWSAPGLPLE